MARKQFACCFDRIIDTHIYIPPNNNSTGIGIQITIRLINTVARAVLFIHPNIHGHAMIEEVYEARYKQNWPGIRVHVPQHTPNTCCQAIHISLGTHWSKTSAGTNTISNLNYEPVRQLLGYRPEPTYQFEHCLLRRYPKNKRMDKILIISKTMRAN